MALRYVARIRLPLSSIFWLLQIYVLSRCSFLNQKYRQSYLNSSLSSTPSCFPKRFATIAIIGLAVSPFQASPTLSARVPAQYPISLFNQTLCRGFIETAKVPNQVCFDFPDETVASVHISSGSVPEGWQWYAYSSVGCVNSIGIILQGGCQAMSIDGERILLVKSVNVVPPS